ncbi:hypothetical protein JAAARDRAFT_511749 [Jaapia argillacea MUCL 33604]|uniref:RING-type domain-containing protein n=1 Tax=Jaapia argillacea MUCL 33604 TaxID=933084 RepID=A0A067QFW2_9AGAM|nr:hypothetical protein JAAARDRAFT_511749 [Jaapia argillacea MUCL 33604]
MNHVKCTSCLEVLPLEAFRLLTCGHAFCNTCALNWIEACRDQAKRPTCPACRHTFSKNDLRPVYITFATVGEVAQAKEDMTKGKAKDVAEKIGLMDATSPAKSVERAAVELEKVAQSISSLDGSQQADTRDLILGAVLEFKDRIAPLYAEVAVNRDRIKELKKSNAALESNSRKLEAGSARLNEKLTEALDTAEEAAVQIVSLRAENRILQQQTEKLETDVAYLNQSLAEKKKEALEWRSRVTKFKKNVMDLTIPFQRKRL